MAENLVCYKLAFMHAGIKEVVGCHVIDLDELLSSSSVGI